MANKTKTYEPWEKRRPAHATPAYLLRLRRDMGMTNVEIGKAHNISPGRVSQLITRALLDEAAAQTPAE